MPVVLRLFLISVTWVGIQIASGFVTHHLPRRVFEADGPLFRQRRWEAHGEIYNRIFAVKRWKDRLPEAGALFPGGVSKRDLQDRSPDTLGVLVAETRRAELTHWLPALLAFSFFAWNPVHVALWMPIIGFFGNAPFIMIQRYLRPRLLALLRRSRRDAQ